MRLVLDTNVLISALWNPESVPALTIGAIFDHGVDVLYDARALAEYREVLARPKFKKILSAHTDALIAKIVTLGEEIPNVAEWAGPLKDEGDRMFVEIALTGCANLLVTGNLKHFPSDLGFDVHPPATLLATLHYGIARA